ncbi:Concanavalin A-like lectin protein kinase family protein [Hibiscus syriacus]|uniref:Concanavalin A-like lectin protein kinase family protein n=1 Tax=Hibiscus syriacus TaxID=106335 RepID=A0A6A3C7L7_HIBSY|nr:uncharacterized protein LOC120206040 [Hibiscus syriacus]XP_039061716.1 uncharacterized protein LOC120206040 [Hibiscus syriacus]KAE8723029.1 Concanavalin A-like lectin protein kinase family protein [Hibiscus syriacus]
MAAIATRFPLNHRNLAYGCPEFKFPEQPDSLGSDMELEFLEDSDQGILGNCDGDKFRGNNDGNVEGDDDDDGKENDGGSDENSKSFWESQHQALQKTLFRTSSIELRIRNATKEALKDIQTERTVCACRKSSTAENCRSCLMREVCSRLQNAGFNSAVCRTKWRSSPDIPSGEHKFVDVIENSRKGEVRVIIELNFRAEFEIARASEDYNRSVQRLPEVFVGKVERLSNVIKILCSAAKKCMKEKKMHMGPWRKQRYMHAKWLKSCERNTSTQSFPVGCTGSRLTKPRASMLTEDLLGKLSNVRCTALEVV